MHLTIITLIAVLPIFTAAAPLPTPLRGARIPLSKRSGLTNADGSVNSKALKRHFAFVEEKHHRGQAAMSRNDPQNKHISKTSASNGGQFSLTDDAGQLWHGTIAVGTPPISYTVDFDTGSSDLFLPGPTCNTSCEGHTIYNPNTSTTSKDLGKTFTLQYGDGSAVTGEQWNDTVIIDGLSAKQQTLGAATQYSHGFSKDLFPPDGLMGMGFQSISIYGAAPVFQTLVTQGSTASPVFSFKLATSGAELYIGGSNRDLYSGSFTYTPVTKQGYWQVVMDSVKVGRKTAVNATNAIIDTGTTLIIGDQQSVDELYQSVPGAQNAFETVAPGFYTVPCASIPDISLTFGGRSFPLSASTFNLGPVHAGSPNCIGGIASGSVASAGWIVGDVFLQNVYSTFDFGHSRVGFATLA